MNPLLLGEANPYGGDPFFALYPNPPRCSGWRLCHVILGLDPDDYLERFDRENLCPEKWSAPVARQRAAQVMSERRDGTIVAFGSKVSNALVGSFNPFTYRVTKYGPHVVQLPHPSRLSRGWDAPDAYARAKSVLRDAGIGL